MKKALFLSALFLFGVYALPGRVCPGARPPAQAVPPCHAGGKPSPNPCDAMVCCLVPPADRGAASPAVLPSAGTVSAPAVPAAPVAASAPAACPPVPADESPPGASPGFLLAYSLRAPPALG